MTNNQWDDDKLEKLLHTMPKIEDNRSKELVLERLKRDQRLKSPRRINPKRWMPAIVAVAALVLLSLLVPSMLNNKDEAMLDSGSSLSQRAKQAMDSSSENEIIEESEDAFDASEAKESSAMTFASVESHVVLEDELADVIPFQIGLMESANVVPITFLIPESLIQSDFPKGNPTTVDLYNKYAAAFPEEELGFDNYHPYKGKLYVENDILHHQIPEEHNYDMSSSTVSNYSISMRETFSGYEKLQLVDEMGNPTSFTSVGDPKAQDLKKPFPYFRYTMPSGKVYLAPKETIESVDTVALGLSGMKDANGDIYESLIPENVDYDVQMEDEIAVISFKEQLDVNAFDQNIVNQMIEGFMLTAKGYDKQVRLENVVQGSFGKYDLSEPLPMPIGSNPTWFTP